jgi:hypothetical protein
MAISVSADQSDPINGQPDTAHMQHYRAPFIIIFLLFAPLAARSVIQSSLNDGIRHFLLPAIMSMRLTTAHQSAYTTSGILPALKTNVRLLSDKTTRAKRCVHYTRNYTNAHQVHSNRFVFVGLLKTSEIYKRAIKNATRMHRDCAYPVIRISRCWERSVFLCVALLDRTPACIHNRKRNNNERQRTRAIFCKPAFQ